MKKHRLLIPVLLTLLFPFSLHGQEIGEQIRNAGKLHGKYEFEKAAGVYKAILEKSTDSLERMAIGQLLIQSENGISLMEYAYKPVVVASGIYDSSSFFLHYSGYPDSSWIKMPSDLLRNYKVGEGYPYMQYSEAAESFIFSAPDEKGIWNIYSVEKLNDTLWSAPVRMNDNITSAGNDIFPVLSRDGKSLYFSSNGHYGIGGYDLYVSAWDSEINDWGVPQNMGIPFSSPSNDYLLYNTPDGNYTIFASDRNTEKGKLQLYALIFENMPLKRKITPEEAEEIARLKVTVAQQKEEGDYPDREDQATGQASEYTIAMERVKGIQASLDNILAKQKANRELYNTLTNEDDLAALKIKIGELEIEAITMQGELGEAVQALQKIEMEFLSKGIIVAEEEDSNAKQQADYESKSMELAEKFSFADNNLGKTPDVTVMEAIKPVSLEFAILDETPEILDFSSLPGGLVYQIQLYTLSKPVSGMAALKGLSPVFERKSGSSYLYYAGAFSTYTEAAKALSLVRRQGFSSPAIRAFLDGKTVTISSARMKERELAASASYQIVIDGYDTLPQELLTAIRSSTEKDIAKSIENGRGRFSIGPFSDIAEAETLASLLKSISDQIITVEKITK